MTIAERINLHKCGYTRAEIDALAKEEKEAAKNTDPAPETDPKPAEADPKPAETDPKPEEKDPVLEAIKGLTAAIQATNINKDTQPDTSKETMNDLINKV